MDECAPIFDKSRLEEDSEFLVISFWNGWCCVIPKNQKILNARSDTILSANPVSIGYFLHENMHVEEKTRSVVMLAMSNRGCTKFGSYWGWTVQFKGMMCGESELKEVKETLRCLG